MLALSLALITFAVADLLTGGLAAAPRPGLWKRYVLVTCLPALGGALAYWRITGDVVVSAAFFAVLWLGSITWVVGRASGRRAWEIVALLALAGALLAAALIFPAIGAERLVGWLDTHLAGLPWSALQAYGSNAVILTCATLLFLGPTSNGIVRCCLQIVRTTPVEESEATLKGGRFIGPLERVLIFALAVAGQPTAAALIISAKSIIRFPELQSKGKEGRGEGRGGSADESPVPLIDELTEYFLLGSLLSWALALLAVLPLAWA